MADHNPPESGRNGSPASAGRCSSERGSTRVPKAGGGHRRGRHAPAELPLIAWGERRQRAIAQRRRRRRRGLLVALTVLGPTALGLAAAIAPAPRLVWNASASVPLGLYRVWPSAPVAAGDTVVVWLPSPARALAAHRRYLPWDVPAVKRVAAIAGACVCARGPGVWIDGKRVATRLAADRRGRSLPWWSGCRTLASDELFLLVPESADSFDGRYFGLSPQRDVIGRARLVWASRSPGGGA